MSKLQSSDLLTEVTSFISRYLECSSHQRTVLALWVLHTHCFQFAQVTPYLSIQSSHKQSGKTLCLQLLSVLCQDPSLAPGFTLSRLRKNPKPPSAVLLDECQATLGTRARSKAPVLRALLAGSFHRGLATDQGQDRDEDQRRMFCPKAFAGAGQLPEELADRSIPIILQPQATGSDLLEAQPEIENQESKSRAERFHLGRALQEAAPLKQRLAAWSEQHLPELEKLSPYSEEQFPPGLSPRRQDLCEPLLQLADAIGGDWPERIRQALTVIFEDAAVFDLQAGTQLLADVHQCFFFHGFPDRLSTSILLHWLHTLPARPWDENGPLSAHTLARLLGAFDIRPRVQRVDKGNPSRGYQLHDFLEPWRRRLGFAPPNPAAPSLVPLFAALHASRNAATLPLTVPQSGPSKTPPQTAEQPSDPNHTTGKPSVGPALKNGDRDNNKEVVTLKRKSRIAGKNGLCNTVADARMPSITQGVDEASTEPGRNGGTAVKGQLSRL